MLAEIKLDNSVKVEVVAKLGSFDAEFLMDFFSKEVGGFYYNQGLADALKSFESKMEGVGEMIYELEKETGKSSS
jgi:uncharacterized protein (DUF2164 family)